MKVQNKKVIIGDAMSSRLNLLKTLSILFVIYIHSQSLILNNSSSLFLIGLNDLVSNGISRTAVPIFFMLSGYFLFFDNSGLDKIKFKLKKRLKTLVVPFLIWNVSFYIILFTAVYVFSLDFSGVTRGKDIVSFEVIEHVKFILGIGDEPALYQFWFVRDLIIILPFSPLLYRLSEKIPFIFGFSLLLVWFFDYEIYTIFSSDTILFFYAGILLSQYKLEHDEVKISNLAHVIFLVLLVANTLYFGRGYVYKMMILFGIISIYDFTRILMGSKIVGVLISYTSPFIFFVFASHEPLLTLIIKVVSMARVSSATYMALIYLSMPILLLFILASVGKLVKNSNHKFYSILTGSR